MFDNCFKDFEKHTGVKVSKTRTAELRDAFENAYLDASRSMSPQEAMTFAANAVSDSIMTTAKLDKLHKLRDAQAQQAMLGYIGSKPEFSPAMAARRMLSDFYDLKTGRMSVEQQAKAIRSIEVARIDAMFQEIGTKFGITLNKETELVMLKALYGEEIPAELGKFSELAKAHIEAMNALKGRLEASGIKIGEIKNYFGSQYWDADLVRNAWRKSENAKDLKTDAEQRAVAKEMFVRDMFEAADRAEYKDAAGMPMSDDQLMAYLGGAFENIFLDSALSLNRVSGPKVIESQLSRKIHIKDAASYQKLTQRYSGQTVLDSMLGSVNDISKSIALVENFGPNFERNINDTLKIANSGFKKATTKKQAEQASKDEKKFQRELEYFTYGENVVDGAFRTTMQAARAAQRNVLGGAMITSLFGDVASKAFIYRMNKASGMDKILLDMTKMSKEELRDNSLIAERFQSAMVREVGEIPEKGLISYASTLNIRASLLPALNRARLNAGREHMAATLGAKVKKYAWEDIDGVDGQILKDYGFTQADWDLMRQVKGDYMTVKSVLELDAPDLVKRKLAERVQSYVLGEIDIYMEPGNRLQSVMRGTTTAGTLGGELFRNFLQFKTFTGVMLTQIYPRLIAAGSKSGAFGAASLGIGAMVFSYLIAQTIAGLVVEQAKSLVSGKNPLDVTDPRVLMKGAITGGGLSIMGDLLMASESRTGGGLAELIAGPVGGTAATLLETSLRPLHQAMDDKELDVGADIFRKVRSITPLTSLWYTRAMVDRMIMTPINEELSPGYTQRADARMERDYGQTRWWDMDEAFPDELPDFSEVVE